MSRTGAIIPVRGTLSSILAGSPVPGEVVNVTDARRGAVVSPQGTRLMSLRPGRPGNLAVVSHGGNTGSLAAFSITGINGSSPLVQAYLDVYAAGEDVVILTSADQVQTFTNGFTGQLPDNAQFLWLPELTTLTLYGCGATSIRVEYCPKLNYLDLGGNTSTTSWTFSHLPAIDTLAVDGSTNFDLADLTALEAVLPDRTGLSAGYIGFSSTAAASDSYAAVLALIQAKNYDTNPAS